jgi:hypothetical protein
MQLQSSRMPHSGGVGISPLRQGRLDSPVGKQGRGAGPLSSLSVRLSTQYQVTDFLPSVGNLVCFFFL